MPSSKDRERKLARAKIERQQTRRAHKIRAQRQVQAQVIAAVAILAVAALIGWGTNWYGITSPKKTAAAECTWTPAKATTLKNVGLPPTTGIPMSGTAPMTITTNQGVINATLDVTQAPCTSESFSYLAAKQFFNNTTCHRLVAKDPLFLLQCGSQNGFSTGGPTYTLQDENIPLTPDTGASPTGPSTTVYKAGTIAMALNADPTTGAVTPNTGGSQFFLVYKDTTLPDSYPIVGSFDAAGIAVVNKIAAGGVAAGGTSSTDGPPKLTTTVQSLTVGKVVPPSLAPSAPSSSATPSTTSSAKPSAPSSSKS